MIDWLRIFVARLRGLFGTNRLEQELDDELREHIELLVEENIRRGVTPADARRSALRSFGGVEQVKEAYRDQRGLPIVETLLQDLRYAVRMLRKNPGFTTVAVATLALGIGANTAIFSVLDAVMIELLPVKNPRELVMLRWTAPGQPSVAEDLEGSSPPTSDGGVASESISYPAYKLLRERNTVFSELFAFGSNIQDFNVQFNGQAHSALTEPVSGNYFKALGVQPILGRAILDDDDSLVAPAVAVVSHRFWQSKLGGNSSVVDGTMIVNNIPLTVIGVAPPEFFGTQPGNSIDIWIPLNLFPRMIQALVSGPPQPGTDPAAAAAEYWQKPTTWWLVATGRLKPSISEQQARAELQVMFDQSLDAIPKTSTEPEKNRPVLVTAAGGQGMDELRRRFSSPLMVLMTAVGLVLLIACANVAGLLVGRVSARRKEIAVRLSLGAGRLRLIQQLLTESVLLAVSGGLLGLTIAHWLGELLVAMVADGRNAPTIPLQINQRVLLFTAALAVLTSILFGLAPALSATRMSLASALKAGGTAGRLAAGRSRLARPLVSAQVALSLLLLTGAGLFLRTLQNLEHVPLGFDRERLLFFSVSPGLNGYSGSRLAQYYREMQEQIAAIPGVLSVSFSGHGPVGHGASSTNAAIPGATTGAQRFDFHRHVVGPRYFETLGIPMLSGRALDEHDDDKSSKVAVINQTLGRQAFGEESPIGKVLRFGSATRPRDFEIVGVAGDARYNSLRDIPPPTAYFSHLQALGSASFMTFEVRTNVEPSQAIPLIRSEAAKVDANIPLNRVETLEQTIDKTLMLERMFSRLTSWFALLALVLACIGLYGAMSYSVSRQTNDIGIRMALGATPAGVFKNVLGEGFKLTGAGLVAGLAAAFATTRLISESLYGVEAIDPATLACVVVLLLAVGLFACYLPARRAMRVDPIIALRYE